jgi:hypothetical protein
VASPQRRPRPRFARHTGRRPGERTGCQTGGWQELAGSGELASDIDSAEPGTGRSAARRIDWATRRGRAGLARGPRFADPRFDVFRYNWNRWLQQLPLPSADSLAVAAGAASNQPARVSTAEVESVWRQFRNDVLNLENRLRRLRNDGGWGNYLQLAKVNDATRSLDATRSQWQSVDSLPERWRLAALMCPLAELQQAAASFDRLSRKARVVADPNFAGQRADRLARLAALLPDQSKYEDDLPPGEVAEICHWLRQRGSELSLADAVERRFGGPNFLVRVPNNALRDQLNRQLDETFRVNDVIAGTRVRGDGQLSGQVTGRFLPRISQGALELVLQGQTVASTSGYNSGARISSTGVTQLRGTKRVLIDARGVHPLPSAVDADTRISYNSVNAPNNRYGREVRGRVYGTRGRAESESAQKAASYVRSTIDSAVDGPAVALNKNLRQRIFVPLASRQVWPQTHEIRSDPSGLTIALLQKLPAQFGAPPPPPPVAGSAAIQILVHTSLVERLAACLLQGKTLEGGDLLQARPSREPVSAPADAADRWTLTFASVNPVSVVFRDGSVQITVRLAGFRSNDRDYAGTEISVLYRLCLQADQLIMVRDGEFRVYPLGFISGQQRLSGPQLVTRQVLQRRLEESVPAEFDLGGFLGQGQTEWGRFTGFSISEGWLSLDLATTRTPPPQRQRDLAPVRETSE